MKSTVLLSPLTTLSSLFKKIPKDLRLAFLSAAIIDLLANMFMYTNSLFLHDNTSPYNYLDGLPSGRFMLNLLFDIFGRIQMPWLTGIVSAVLIGLTSAFIVYLLKIKDPVCIVLLSGAIVSSPTLIATHFYFSILPVYLFAMLMSVMAVYFAQKGRYWIILSAVCLVFSLGCYQAYISLTLVLMLLVVIRTITDSGDTAKKIFFICLRLVATAAAGLLIYYFTWQLLLKVTGTAAQSYRGEDNVIGWMLGEPVKNIVTAWCISLYYIFTNYMKENVFVYVLRLLIAALSLIVPLILLPQKMKTLTAGKRVLLCLCVFLLPLAISFIYVLNPITPYVLMLFTLITPQFILLMDIDRLPESAAFNAVRWVSVLLVLTLTLSDIVYANESYTAFKSDYDNALSYSTRLVDRIEQTDGYTIDTEVVACTGGDVNTRVSPYKDKRTWIDDLPDLPVLHSKSAVTYGETLQWFINDDLNVGMDFSYDTQEQYKDLPQVQELSAFPAKNCTVWIDGVLVVKV